MAYFAYDLFSFPHITLIVLEESLVVLDLLQVILINSILKLNEFVRESQRSQVVLVVLSQLVPHLDQIHEHLSVLLDDIGPLTKDIVIHDVDEEVLGASLSLEPLDHKQSVD